MAIIRIKRTTTTNTPTGLTFGEMAFIGRTGGAIANQVYIGDAQGNSVWVGARILNAPEFWSGVTAETTVPTVQAVRDFVNSFVLGQTFSSDIVANLGGTKSFGRYVNGDTVPAQNKTAIQVILDALIEAVGLCASIQTRTGWGDPTVTYSAIPFGATAIRTGITWGYQINTPGATAVYGAIEFRRNNTGAWTTLTTTAYDTTSPFYTQTTPNGLTLNPFTHSFTQTAYDTTQINYRYVVNDTSGGGTATVEAAAITPTAYATPTNTTTLTAQISEPLGGSTNRLRERGNSGSTLSITLNANNDTRWINLNAYLVQYRLNGAGSWYNALNNTINDTTFTTITPAAGTCAATISVRPTIAGVTLIEFQIQAKDTFSTSGIVTSGSIPPVSLRKRIFYGATYSDFFTNVNRNPNSVRTLPNSFLGPTAGTAIAAGSASFSFTSDPSSSFLRYVIALPKGLTLNSTASGGGNGVEIPGEVLAGKADPTQDACQLTLGLTQGADFVGSSSDYNFFTWGPLGEQYSLNTTITVRYNGTVI